MNKQDQVRRDQISETEFNPKQGIDGGVSAHPTGHEPVENARRASDLTEANERDARISGYTDENGKAVDRAKPDVKGSPTGAFTDIGAGRSSVVKHRSH